MQIYGVIANFIENSYENLTHWWHTGVKKTPGMFNLNLRPFNIWKWYLYGPVTLVSVKNFFVKNVIFRYFLTSTTFSILKMNFELNNLQHSLKWLSKSA